MRRRGVSGKEEAGTEGREGGNGRIKGHKCGVKDIPAVYAPPKSEILDPPLRAAASTF